MSHGCSCTLTRIGSVFLLGSGAVGCNGLDEPDQKVELDASKIAA